MKKKFRSIMLSLAAVSGMLLSLFSSLEVKAAEWQWNFSCTGAAQTFTAAETGIYRFILYGAQGGHYTVAGEETSLGGDGGLGGKVTCYITLNAGDTVTVCVGGQGGGEYATNGTGSGNIGGGSHISGGSFISSTGAGSSAKSSWEITAPSSVVKGGYGGETGGFGVASGGGGATSVKVNGTVAAVAGGGGGGTETKNGENGGSMDTGEGSTELPDSGIDIIHSSNKNSLWFGSAGGGGGYTCGKAGQYDTYTTSHSHDSSCYEVTTEKCGGTITYFDRWTSSDNPDGTSEGEQYYLRGYECNKCNHIYASWKADETHSDYSYLNNTECERVTSQSKKLICTQTTGEQEQVIDEAAKGGTSWYDTSVCMETQGIVHTTVEAGVRQGNGSCEVNMVRYNLFYSNIATEKVYYDGIPVKIVYYNGNLVYMN